MRVYVDSSALLKRIFAESDSPAAVSLLRSHVDAGDTLATSSLAWIEVSRVVLGRIAGLVWRDEVKTVGEEPIRSSNADALIEIALSGLVEKPMSPDVIALARRLRPTVLRSLDAIHLSSALLLDSDRVVTYASDWQTRPAITASRSRRRSFLGREYACNDLPAAGSACAHATPAGVRRRDDGRWRCNRGGHGGSPAQWSTRSRWRCRSTTTSR